jgi:hypothetical protein
MEATPARTLRYNRTASVYDTPGHNMAGPSPCRAAARDLPAGGLREQARAAASGRGTRADRRSAAGAAAQGSRAPAQAVATFFADQCNHWHAGTVAP